MISLKEMFRGLNRFFFEPESPLPIALYRILLGIVVLCNHAMLLPEISDWFTSEGVISGATARKLVGGGGVSLFNYLPTGDFWVWTVFLLSCLSALTFTLGLFTRTSAAILFITLLSLHNRNPLILNSGDTFIRIASFFMIFSQAGAALSIDRLIRIARGREAGPPIPREPWAMRLIQIQIAFLYLYAFVWKVLGTMWLSGIAVYYTSRLPEFWRFPVPYIFEHVWTIKLWSWFTLVIELALGTLIWFKELRYWVLLAGVMLHLGIEYSMNIPLFGLTMVTTYVTFVEPHRLQQAFAWLRRKINSATKFRSPIPVLYDGNCSFCIRSLAVVERLNVLRRLDFQNMHAPEIRASHPDFDSNRGNEEMLVRTEQGWLGGFFAFRYLAHHLPLLWPIVPFLYLPPVAKAGDKVYKRIAARRYCILKPAQYAAEPKS